MNKSLTTIDRTFTGRSNDKYMMAAGIGIGTGIASPVASDPYKRTFDGRSPVSSLLMTTGWGDDEKNAVPVTQHSILSIAPYWRATNILCGLVGRVKIELKRKGTRNKTEVARDDDRHFLISKKPHKNLRARTWKKTQMLHAQIAPSGGFSEIIRNPDTNFPMAILPLDPNRMGWGVVLNAQNQPVRMVYVYQDDPNSFEARSIDPDNILHFKGLSYDAIMAIDTTNLLQREFGLILARQNYTRKYYIGNAKIRGFLMVPAGTDVNLYANMMSVIKEQMDMQNDDPLKTVPLFDGIKYQPTQDSPENSELTDSLKMTPDTIGVITGVPAFMLGSDTRDSYSSLEKVMSSFFTTTVDDWFHEFETEIDDKMLTEEELRAEELCFRFDRRQLMATDVASFHQMLREDLHSGLQAWEECRENIDATTDPSDLAFFVPQNIVGANPTNLGDMQTGTAGNNNAKPTDDDPDGDQSPKKNKKTAAGDGGGDGKGRGSKEKGGKEKGDKGKGGAGRGSTRPSANRVAIRNLAEKSATRFCNRLSKAAKGKAVDVNKFEDYLRRLDEREQEIEQDTMRPVYDVAIGAGLIDRIPPINITERFRVGLEARITEHHDIPFVQVITAECDRLTTEIVNEITDSVVGLVATVAA